MNVLNQWESQQDEKAGMGSLWVEHRLVLPRDGYMPRDGGVPGGLQDSEKVSAWWRRTRARRAAG